MGQNIIDFVPKMGQDASDFVLKMGQATLILLQKWVKTEFIELQSADLQIRRFTMYRLQSYIVNRLIV